MIVPLMKRLFKYDVSTKWQQPFKYQTMTNIETPDGVNFAADILLVQHELLYS